MLNSYEILFESEHRQARCLRMFAEIAVVTNHAAKNVRGKLTDRGKTSMFVGYGVDTDSEVYRFLNPTTKRIVVSRDVTWLGKTYGAWKRNQERDTSMYQVDDE